ncbi:alpha/beta hydrolase fold-3 domain-containing protein [Truncatella angustata]|uniref:Alpha/beta hydrolase fold-3 domain-containing protein n=1 Tax=Truncatella angustata TaxID=152316 RepID=A0A9P8ZVY9_9PEZI|nr:alpha/beta hydrolase fold-3 domain-containing protein [Truncatella angustata]KAH6652426.1 alpha/beta hydrolase fold-3 domain-containing protein [Truncatella angustata]
MPNSNSWPLKSYQPIRLVYQLCCVSAIVARFPIWLVRFGLFRCLRPHPQWTLKQSIMIRLIRLIVNAQSHVGISDPITLKPGAEKERFEVIRPFLKEFYQGPLDSTVAPTTIGGTWYPNVTRGRSVGSNDYVILHLHGGAYVTGNGRDASLGFLANTLVKYAGAVAIFAPQYRLSGYDNTNPFPAALQDALTSYLHLVRTLDIHASSIVVSGDSAGGNLAIAFLRYLSEYGKELNIPNPRSAVLLSPWVSPLNALGADVTYTSNPYYSTDYLPSEFTRWGAITYIGSNLASDPYITPLGNPFVTPVPMFVNTGAIEMLNIDGTQWLKEMTREKGNTIHYEYEPVAPHDTLLIGYMSGWEDSARNVSVKIGEFIRSTDISLYSRYKEV